MRCWRRTGSAGWRSSGRSPASRIRSCARQSWPSKRRWIWIRAISPRRSHACCGTPTPPSSSCSPSRRTRRIPSTRRGFWKSRSAGRRPRSSSGGRSSWPRTTPSRSTIGNTPRRSRAGAKTPRPARFWISSCNSIRTIWISGWLWPERSSV